MCPALKVQNPYDLPTVKTPSRSKKITQASRVDTLFASMADLLFSNKPITFSMNLSTWHIFLSGIITQGFTADHSMGNIVICPSGSTTDKRRLRHIKK
jgi:hypothetical protein